MFHPRDDLLSDIAALVEIDAAELIHVGFVRKHIAEAKSMPPSRHAERDAMGVIGLAVDEIGADQVGHLLLEIFGRGIRQPSASSRGSAKARSGFVAGSPSHTASTPMLSETFSTATLARSL